jgi:hypothetical protein
MTCQTIYVIVIYGGQLEKPNLPRNELHTKFYCLKRRP